MKKTCRKCKLPKKIDEFSWKRKKENKRHTICKECKRKVDGSYYQSSIKRRKQIRKRASESYEYLKQYVQRLKKFGECKKCKDKRWYVLDFHHLGNKIENVNELLRRGSITKIKDEIRKCILLCANCHRELHHNEKKGL